MLFWLRKLVVLFAKRASLADEPPPLPYRCGTMFLRADPEGRRRIGRSWREQEQRFIDWVEAHHFPEPEWLEKVERLKQDHAAENGHGRIHLAAVTMIAPAAGEL